MVQQDYHFSDGTRIFYEENNGHLHRFIEYSYTPREREMVKNNPIIDKILCKKVRKFNAGKYYYLRVLQGISSGLSEIQRIQLLDELKNLHDKTGRIVESGILNQEFVVIFGKYWPDNRIQCAAFFTTIYLAMVDLEDGKKNYPHSLGKTMVLKSCKAVILEGADYKEAATMFESKQEDTSYDYWEGDYSGRESPYEKYNGYNGYDDDTIDIAFDGHPKATWDVD